VGDRAIALAENREIHDDDVVAAADVRLGDAARQS
jgi:hypothetical protein